MSLTKPTGLTKDSGFQIGARKTFSVSVENAWDFLFSPEGLQIWLGKIRPEEFEPDKQYNTQDGIEGQVSVFKPYSHIRLTWKKPGWNNFSALQIRVIPSKEKVTISFHQDKLTGGQQREEMKKHWIHVLNKLKQLEVSG